MKNVPGRSSAASMVFIALFARLFWGMAVDFPACYSAVWICPLLGLILYLPFGLAIQTASSLGNNSPWENLAARCPFRIAQFAELIFSLLLLLDGALSMRLMANTANALALGNTSIPLLLIPLGVLVAISVLLGADAEGNSARLWMYALPLLFLIMFLGQRSSYRLAWLSPILGGGIQEIFSGSIYCSGCIAILSLPWMIAVPDRNHKPIWKYVLLAVICASILLALTQMLCPPLTDLDLARTRRIKLLLANGRITLSLQMVMIVLWYGALMHLIATEAVSAAACLHRILPTAPQWALASGVSIVMTLLAISALTASSQYLRHLRWYFPAIGTVLIAVLLFGFTERRNKTCVKRR